MIEEVAGAAEDELMGEFFDENNIEKKSGFLDNEAAKIMPQRIDAEKLEEEATAEEETKTEEKAEPEIGNPDGEEPGRVSDNEHFESDNKNKNAVRNKIANPVSSFN